MEVAVDSGLDLALRGRDHVHRQIGGTLECADAHNLEGVGHRQL